VGLWVNVVFNLLLEGNFLLDHGQHIGLED
jgi:hypothetical protein